jgi:uncharacterized protein YaaW (UPF0174 family)
MTTDKDLRFLSSCENEDLRVLCDILTHDRLGNIRVTEQLTSTDEYNRNYPEDMLFLVPQISNELLKYGSNTLATFWHNEPDSYETVLRRVCKQMDVRTVEQDSVAKMEHNLLTTLCQDTLNKMSERELRLLANENGIPDKTLTRQALTAALLMAVRTSRAVLTRIAARVIQYIVELITIRGVATAGIETATRAVGGALGPIGWIALGAWTVYDITSPAYRVCVPAVLQVAYMRLNRFEKERSVA